MNAGIVETMDNTIFHITHHVFAKPAIYIAKVSDLQNTYLF